MLVLNAFVAGTLFGLGLAVSEMVNPGRVIGFLDVAGRWDPTLAFVMAGALAVSLPGFTIVLRQRAPVFHHEFHLPTRTKIDRPLVLGAALFGIGWGVAGFCPGPALAALVSGKPETWLFVAAMAAGLWLAARIPWFTRA
jgi:uncharacterized protein